MTKEEMKQECQRLTMVAQEVYSKNRGHQPQAMVYWRKDGKLQCALFVLVGDDAVNNRQKVLRKIGRMFFDKFIPIVDRCEGIIFISEAWVSVYDKNRNYDGKLMPSQDPQKIDALVLTAMNEKMEAYIVSYKVIKHPEGSVLFEMMNESSDEKGVSTQAFLLEEFWKGMGMIIDKKI